MRILALAAQRGALIDAKAVLFVDDGQLQIFKLDRFFEQRVRADQDFDLTRGETRLNRLPLPAAGVAG